MLCDAAIATGTIRRFIDHGTTDKVRTVNEDRLHPEYKNWQWLKRQGKLCPEWQAFSYLCRGGWRASLASSLGGPASCPKRLTVPITSSGPRQIGSRIQCQLARGTSGLSTGANGQRSPVIGWRKSEAVLRLTRVQYEEILMSQGGTCALCDKTEDTVDGKPRLLSVDHDIDRLRFVAFFVIL